MRTIHVGGFNPFNRVKTLEDALQKAKDDDTIELHKSEKIASQIDKNLIIKGNGNTLIVETGQAGLIVNKPVIIENVKFKVNSRANALIINEHTILDDVSVELIGPIREFYPVILNKASLEINGGRYTKIETIDESQTVINNAELYSYYGGDIHLSTNANASHLHGVTTINNSILNSTVLYDTITINHSTIGKYVDIMNGKVEITQLHVEPLTSEPIIKLKKEPTRGPLEHQTESLYGLKILDSDIIIDDYTIEQISDNFWGFYGDKAFVTLKNVNNPINITSHKFVNSTITFDNSTDENLWILEDTTSSFVRSQINTNINVETAADKLNKLIGLQSVKEQFKTIMNTITVGRESTDNNYTFSNHFIFAGDPGTGKTTIAEIFAEAMFEVGAIPENKITKVTVDDLIKGYVGQTADNVRQILDKALGGVVFIDEAYQLTVKNGQNTFNDEALSVLIRYMEDNRGNLIVIAAGYTKEMKEFLASNIGLSRRFQWLQFEDYNANEMSQIFELVRQTYKDEYEDPSIVKALPILFDKLISVNLSIPDANGRITNGGNGGLVRNVYQQVAQHKNNRIVEGGTRNITKDDIEFAFKQQIETALQRKI